jgi:hypothetical protein
MLKKIFLLIAVVFGISAQAGIKSAAVWPLEKIDRFQRSIFNIKTAKGKVLLALVGVYHVMTHGNPRQLFGADNKPVDKFGLCLVHNLLQLVSFDRLEGSGGYTRSNLLTVLTLVLTAINYDRDVNEARLAAKKTADEAKAVPAGQEKVAVQAESVPVKA